MRECGTVEQPQPTGTARGHPSHEHEESHVGEIGNAVGDRRAAGLRRPDGGARNNPATLRAIAVADLHNLVFQRDFAIVSAITAGALS